MIRWPSVTRMPVVSVSSTTLRTLQPSHFVDATVGQLVGTFVTRMAGMAAYPLPGHLVPIHLLVQLAPQIGILHRLFGGGFPAAFLPVRHPVLDTLHDVLRVGH